MGMLNTHATMIPASPGFEVVSIEAAGEIARWPVIAWGLNYGYGDGILPIVIGVHFNADVHALAMPDGRVLSMATGTPQWWKDAQTWGDAINAAMATDAWHAAGVPVAGEA